MKTKFIFALFSLFLLFQGAYAQTLQCEMTLEENGYFYFLTLELTQKKDQIVLHKKDLPQNKAIGVSTDLGLIFDLPINGQMNRFFLQKDGPQRWSVEKWENQQLSETGYCL